ncbi:PAS domain-containing sensor histidine kinase [Rhizobium sp. L1K21]|uniref:sensor histidine kinase NtrY-like n=1 Tax=Rhizobium sp. L1K21 TaxID=2954933 RepID=UPI0020937FC0|nr:PAS domain-containing sensor histidine kinase [Rhizobium sp. L1K21]MCO6185940.1 PAS domain-containing sensor histidine kinase [Rhizobium sp. L1K21]
MLGQMTTQDEDELGGPKDRRAIFALSGLVLAGGALTSAIVTLFVLLGFTPIEPQTNVVIASAVINGLFVVGLVYLIGREVVRLLKARKRGRAAARLHVRIVSLFSIVALTPALLVAIFAAITLDAGLDRWFSLRTQSIVSSSINVAQAYVLENASYLQGQTASMAADLERARSLYVLDRGGFTQLLTREAQGRGMLGAFLVRNDGSVIVEAATESDRRLPAIPKDALESSIAGKPTLIPPGVTNLVGAVMKLEQLNGAHLYTIRAVDPKVMDALHLMEDNTAEYKAMEAGRTTLQIAFAILYLGFALIALLAAIWAAIAIADRIVRPIRLLIAAADSVAGGNMNVMVPVRAADGDVGNLSRTFNKMISEIRTQRDEILEAKDEVDDRRRFIEAVLSGVTPAVIGVDENGKVNVVNSGAYIYLRSGKGAVVGGALDDMAPAVAEVFNEAVRRGRKAYRQQINLMIGGRERSLNVQVTREESREDKSSWVITIDDITDLVIAQRSTAWADVARRIAHEIKNPLTPIQLSAERIKRRYGRQIDESDRDVFDQCTDTIIRQVGDIGRMVDEFSSFARMPKPAMGMCDLRGVLKDAVFLREMGTSHVSFEKDLGDVPLEGYFDARMLGQAFSNLVKNAVEAIEAVPSEDAPETPRVLVRAYEDTAHGRLTVDVIDNGKGLPVENRHMILEPYMTMREKGTGLGLAIVKKIVEEHGGSLELHDAPPEFDHGRGAMIRVHLPRRDSAAAQQSEKREAINGV